MCFFGFFHEKKNQTTPKQHCFRVLGLFGFCIKYQTDPKQIRSFFFFLKIIRKNDVTEFFCLYNEWILGRIDINIGDGGQRKILSKLVNCGFKFLVEILCHIIIRGGTTVFIHLRRRNQVPIHYVRQATNGTRVVYPKWSPASIVHFLFNYNFFSRNN